MLAVDEENKIKTNEKFNKKNGLLIFAFISNKLITPIRIFHLFFVRVNLRPKVAALLWITKIESEQ